jgi:hypothetical protein
VCKLPKVVIVAPDHIGDDLRRKLSSLEYDIAAVVASVDDAAEITADVALAWEPDEETLLRLRELSMKTVAIGGEGATADLHLHPDEVSAFKTRFYELFKPA